ncbi:unnamed protein product [Gordionus sp. m RMFG-2023]
MAAKLPDERWYFTKEELNKTPSIIAGLSYEKELMYRQQCANVIQDMGQKLSVNQLCISTAIVYMHRFYMLHSFTLFSRHCIAACSLFLAAKVEEQFRKVDHVVKVLYACQFKEKTQPIDVNCDLYQNLATELITNESIMLQTLGFDITIDHPHSHVVKCCQLIRAPKDLAQVSYIMATNSLHLTLLCLQYKPSVVACVCIYIACKWSNWEIPRSTEGKEWFWYIDKDVTLLIIQTAMEEFMNIYAKSPHKLKMKLFKKDESTEKKSKTDLVEEDIHNPTMKNKINDAAMFKILARETLSAHDDSNLFSASLSLEEGEISSAFEFNITCKSKNELALPAKSINTILEQTKNSSLLNLSNQNNVPIPKHPDTNSGNTSSTAVDLLGQTLNDIQNHMLFGQQNGPSSKSSNKSQHNHEMESKKKSNYSSDEAINTGRHSSSQNKSHKHCREKHKHHHNHSRPHDNLKESDLDDKGEGASLDTCKYCDHYRDKKAKKMRKNSSSDPDSKKDVKENETHSAVTKHEKEDHIARDNGLFLDQPLPPSSSPTLAFLEEQKARLEINLKKLKPPLLPLSPLPSPSSEPSPSQVTNPGIVAKDVYLSSTFNFAPTQS